MYKATEELKTKLKQCGLKVIKVDVPEFLKSGESSKCLTFAM